MRAWAPAVENKRGRGQRILREPRSSNRTPTPPILRFRISFSSFLSFPPEWNLLGRDLLICCDNLIIS